MAEKKDDSIKLYEVLLKEYEKLGILDEEISKINRESDAAFYGLDWKDISINEWIQAQRLKKIRNHLPESADAEGEKEQKIRVNSPSALCFSGGGIRSATFCLGVLQGLAKYSLLDKFDYLSTVSGGGYIGAWLSAWIDRAGSVEKVQAALSRDETNPYLFELKDFNIDFESPGAVGKIKELKSKLNLHTEYFTPEKRAKLNSIELPAETDEESSTGNHQTREFLKEFCKTLNRILLEKRIVAENQEYSLLIQESSIIQIAETREELEGIFDEFLAKPFLFTPETLEADSSNEIILALLKETAEKPKAEDFYRNLFLRLNEKKDAEKSLFQKLFLDKINEKILQIRGGNIEKLKERRRIYKKLKDVFKEYKESELLQNKETANAKVEPEEITHLRTYSNYMSPKLGLFSTDTFSLIALYLRNLLLNWLVFVPIIAAGLLLPKLYLWIIENKDFFPAFHYGYLLFLVSLIAIFGLIFINIYRPSLGEETGINQSYETDDIGVTKTFEGRIKSRCFYPLVLTSIILAVYWEWLKIPVPEIGEFKIHFVVFGVVLFLLGFILARSFFFGWNIFRLKVKADPAAKKYSYSDYENIGKEILISLFCGATGGLILYFATERFLRFINEGFANFPKLKAEFIDSVYVSFAPPIFLLVFLISATLFIGIASKITDDMDREWMNRFGALVLKFIVAWIVVFCTVLLGDAILQEMIDYFTESTQIAPALLASIGGISGLITLGFGFSSASTEGKDESASSLKNTISSVAPQIAAPVFIIFLIGLIAYLTDSLMEHTVIESPWLWFLILAALGGLMGLWININKFSLHAMYRERLIRTYLGASRIKERFKTANSFTGLDMRDNVQMKYLVHKPFHVVNMTLNLVKTRDLRWQNRKAESFTASALFCGSSNMGNGTGHFRSSEKYGHNAQNQRSITLGTAAAISGAAATPNMGYYTVSSAVSFLMTLFNIRLGWWLGNPGKKGEHTYKQASPTWAPKLLFDEALGNTTNTYPYIYVSDGGHFENLGIYEMVLRRCKFILAIDAGADGKFTFSDLGNAVHKIRVDMGIPIVFREEPAEEKYATVADIKYSEIDGTDKADDGVIVYIKPTLDGTEPIDIHQYKSVSKDFPHETTADQMYSETQFESYRSLGFHIIDTICLGKNGENLKCDDFNELIILVNNYLAELIEKCEAKKKADQDRKDK